MGAIVTCVAGGVCCCCGVCCNQIVDALAKLFGTERLTKMYYIVLVVIFVVPAIFVFFFLYNWTAFKDYFGKWFNCPNDEGLDFCYFQVLVYWSICSLQTFSQSFRLVSLDDIIDAMQKQMLPSDEWGAVSI